MLEVVIRVSPTRSWLTELASKYDTEVRVHDCAPFGKDGAQGIIEIDAEADGSNGIFEELRSHPDVSGLHLVRSEDEKIVISVVTREWVACSAIMKSDCYLRDAKAFPEGFVEWRLHTPNVKTLGEIVKALENAGCQVELVKKRKITSEDRLTDRQLLVVRKALELGYFDHPRRITVRELARRTKVAPSTLSEMLKRAGKKMAEFYMRKGRV